MTQDPHQQGRSKFWSLPDREQVRERPPMFVGQVDGYGLFRMFRTVLANALVEYALRHATAITVTLHRDGSVSVEDDGSGMPINPDVRIGEPGILHRLTNLNRHDSQWPHRELRSVRWYHPGLACVNFLSSRFEVATCRDGTLFSRRFRQGIEHPEHPSHLGGLEKGSYIFWKPDEEIFGATPYDARELTNWLQLQALLHPGVRIQWRDEVGGHQHLFHEPGGISIALAQRTSDHKMLHPPQRLTVERNGDALDLASVFTSSEGAILLYANGEGFEVDRLLLSYFQRGAYRVLRTWAIRQGLLPPALHLNPDGLLNGLHAILAFQLRVPTAEGCQCQRLAALEVGPLAYAAGRRMMKHLVQEHPDVTARVVQRACRTTRAETS